MRTPVDPCLPIARDIEARGWSCHDGFVDTVLARALLDEAQSAHHRGDFRSGAVGMGASRVVRPEVRGDEICWLAAETSPALAAFTRSLEALRLLLNRELQLGLFAHESHFARYAPGTFYARHLDQPAASHQRILSVACYLNTDWLPSQGGALRLHIEARAPIDVLPQAGRLVLFLSDRFEHEVLPATRERWSLTGWFRGRD